MQADKIFKKGLLAWLVAAVFVLWVFSSQTSYAVLNKGVSESLLLTIKQVSFISSIYTWCFACTQLFYGSLLDEMGARKILLPAIGLVCFGILLFSISKNFYMLVFSQMVIAVGGSAGFVGAGYVAASWFGIARFGLMMGLVQFGTSLTAAFSQSAINIGIGFLTWREIMGIFALFGVFLLILAFVFLYNPSPVARQTNGNIFLSVLKRLKKVIRIYQIDLIAFQGSLVFGSMFALGVVWGPKIMFSQGFSHAVSNHVSSSLWVGLAIGSLVVNKVSDLFQSRKKPIAVSLLFQIILLGLVLFTETGLVSSLMCFVLFGFFNSVHMLSFTSAGDNIDPTLVGTATSIVNGMMFVMAGILVSLPAKILVFINPLPDTIYSILDYRWSISVIFIALLISLLSLMFIKESYPK